jgi:hypothetical protein
VAGVCHDFGQRHGDGFPDPGFAPAAEPAIDRIPTTLFRRDISPWSAASEPPEYPVDNGAILLGRSAAATISRLNRQQAFQNTPFRFGKIASAQACLQKSALNQSL